MRRRTILALIALISVSAVMASPVDPQRAIQVAQQFVPQSTSALRTQGRGSATSPTGNIVYTHDNVDIIGPYFDNNHENTNVSGDDAGWGDGYNLIYRIDGLVYKTIVYESGASIIAEPAPTKEGYTFSSWSAIPRTMPAQDVEVVGYFTVNKYLLTVLVDNQIYYSDSIAYGTRLADYVELITQNGIDLSQWDLYNNIDSITMPAHDITINAVIDAVRPIMNDNDSNIIYDLTGKRIDSDDYSTLPSGIYIRNGRKIIVR